MNILKFHSNTNREISDNNIKIELLRLKKTTAHMRYISVN